jgi:hypothetical protein
LNVLFRRRGRPSGEPRAAGPPAWLEDDTALLLSDTRDLWLIPTDPAGGAPLNLPAGQGRRENRSFTVVRTDPERKSFRRGDRLLLSAYHHREKNGGFYAATIGKTGVSRLLEDKKKFVFKAAAKNAGRFSHPGGLPRVSGFVDGRSRFTAPRKLSSANPRISGFAWGEAELVEWSSADAAPLQGVLIKPGDYEPGGGIPFWSISMSCLPSGFMSSTRSSSTIGLFPGLRHHGYAVFLPVSGLKSAVRECRRSSVWFPGSETDRSGDRRSERHRPSGHSWSGYETAYVVTQTDIFAAACAALRWET